MDTTAVPFKDLNPKLSFCIKTVTWVRYRISSDSPGVARQDKPATAYCFEPACWRDICVIVWQSAPITKERHAPDIQVVDCVSNVTAHAQKPDFVFRRNGRVHLNRRGASVQSTTGSRGVRNSGSNAGYNMFRGSVKSTGYPLHSPVSPFNSPLVRHRVPSHFSWTLQVHNPSRSGNWKFWPTTFMM
jgi:hypothetical protein